MASDYAAAPRWAVSFLRLRQRRHRDSWASRGVWEGRWGRGKRHGRRTAEGQRKGGEGRVEGGKEEETGWDMDYARALYDAEGFFFSLTESHSMPIYFPGEHSETNFRYAMLT